MIPKYKILFVHNAYQIRGGEDGVVEAEINLLKSRGHEVMLYQKHNDDIKSQGRIKAVSNLFWSFDTTKNIKALIHDFKPDIIHSHNTFPLVSPSFYWVANKHNIPVVQTLHNFRLMCLNGVFLRNGVVCEDCVGKVPLKGIKSKCYRGSHLESAALAGMLTTHRAMGTFANKVSMYIALNEFCRGKFIESGIPQDKITIKPNFNDIENPHINHRNNFLFVGRLSTEKGIDVLINAAKKSPMVNINVAGDDGGGADFEGLSDQVNLQLLGRLNQDEVLLEMSKSIALVMPSIWYENLPLTLLEAFASGLPVIASRIGALAELVDDHETGLLFNPSDPGDLADKMQWAKHNPQEMLRMGVNARREYEKKYTSEINYFKLIQIYKNVIDNAKE